MSARLDEAALLEAGLLTAGLAIAGAALALAGGRVAEEVVRRHRHHAAPPERGAVSGERHRQVSVAAAR